MQIFIAGLASETNTFSPLATGMADFEAFELFHGDATAHPERYVYGLLLDRWRCLAEGEGHTVHEGLCAAAEASGVLTRQAYESLRDELLADLARTLAAGPLDMVLLNLHGAMAAHGYDDCEGDLLARVRALAGPDCIIGAELDPHCHLSAAMVAAADVLIAYKEYPHTDTIDCATEVYQLCRDAALGKVRPVTAVFDCRMIGYWHTTREPMAGFVRLMKAREACGGVLSVSLAHGYPWADVADVGAKMWVIADGDSALAAAVAQELGMAFFRLREATRPPTSSLDEAVAALQAAAPDANLVLADIADNAGGGAPGDSTFVLRALIEHGIGNVAVASIWDPLAVLICSRAGVGATLQLRLGGKCSAASGMPVDLEVEVMAVHEAYHQTGLLGTPESLGASAWVRGAGIDIVLSSLRNQVFNADIFSNIGIATTGRRALVVKSSQHFYTSFAPLASRVLYVQTPGGLGEVGSIAYTKRSGPFWPAVDNPF